MTWFDLETAMIPQYRNSGINLKSKIETANWFSIQPWVPEEYRAKWAQLVKAYGG